MEDTDIESFTVEIIINGDTQFYDFSIVPETTLDFVEKRIRSTFGVVNGALSPRRDRLMSIHSFVAGRMYYFIKFSLPADDNKSLGDGLPRIKQCITTSTGSIPTEKQHNSCEAEIESRFFLYDVPEQILKKPNYVWRNANEAGDLWFATENDLARFVADFLDDFIKALQLRLKLHSELGIQHITPDISIISDGFRLVGVVEVKKPGPRILEQPTVLGELLDQLLLIEGFYSCGPVIGIITTLKEWRFAWFPEDNGHFCTDNLDFASSDSVFFTPKKDSKSIQEMKSQSPPGTTPSHVNPQCHRIEETETDDSSTTLPLKNYFERRLCTSEVLDSEMDKERLLKFIYTSLCRMTQVKLRYREGIERCVFKLTKDEEGITWHSLPTTLDINKITSSCRYPYKNIDYLLAVEDLGRGSSGKVWLVMTQTTNPAICVLKFHNRRNLVKQLEMEQKWWHELYPEFDALVHVEYWSGAKALRMPHFSAIPIERREQFFDHIRNLLLEKFGNIYVHEDVRWRNIGMYRNINGDEVPVLYDLESVRNYSEEKDIDWIEVTMKNLIDSA